MLKRLRVLIATLGLATLLGGHIRGESQPVHAGLRGHHIGPCARAEGEQADCGRCGKNG